MLTILKFIRSLFKGLNSDAAPWSCGLAVLIGCLIGLLPLGFHTVLFACLLLVFRAPVASTRGCAGSRTPSWSRS